MTKNDYIIECLDRIKGEKFRSHAHLNETARKGQILFTGSSLMEQFPINELALSDGIDKIIYNRGVGGINTSEFLENMDTLLLDLEPSKLFINIGTNDITLREDGIKWEDSLRANLTTIYGIIASRLPQTQVYVMAFYPVNPDVNPDMADMFTVRTNQAIDRANTIVAELAGQFGFKYIDVNQGLKDQTGALRPEFTKEGLHIYPNGYKTVYDRIKCYL